MFIASNTKIPISILPFFATRFRDGHDSVEVEFILESS